mgnify:CR=1 FL=1
MKRFAALDAVRGLAALSVFFAHLHSVFVSHHIALDLTPVFLMWAGGEAVIQQAQRVLDEMDVLNGAARAARNEFAEPLKLGAIFTVAPDLFPPLVRAIKTGGSGLMLYMEENYTHVLAEKLASGQLDAIIVARPFDPPETHVQTLYRESFALLLPSDSPGSLNAIFVFLQRAEPAAPPECVFMIERRPENAGGSATRRP